MLASNFEPRRRRGFEIASREWRGNGESRETVFVVSMSIRARVLRVYFVCVLHADVETCSLCPYLHKSSASSAERLRNLFIGSLDVAHSRAAQVTDRPR